MNKLNRLTWDYNLIWLSTLLKLGSAWFIPFLDVDEHVQQQEKIKTGLTQRAKRTGVSEVVCFSRSTFSDALLERNR